LDINWPEVVAGFFLGGSPLLIRQTYLYFRFLRSPGKRRYLGHWHGYWRSTTGMGWILQEQIDVRYSYIRNTLLVKTTTPGAKGNSTMQYTGTISERQGVVRYWNLQDSVTQVRETWILVDPYYDPIEVAEGVQVTVDMRGLPVATAQLISRSELELDELERRVANGVINTDPLRSYLDPVKSYLDSVNLDRSGSLMPGGVTNEAASPTELKEAPDIQQP
jgi:hypothetical protein